MHRNMIRLDLPESLGMLWICPVQGGYQAQHEAAHALLAECLPLYAAERKIRLPALPAERSEMGKPFFPDAPELHFNLSHCNGMAACLLSPYECGVDAEKCRPLREKVVRRVFAPEEQKALEASEQPDLLFTQFWTLKEAYVKAIGTGISYPMRELIFHCTEDGFRSDRTDAVFWHTMREDVSVSACLLRVCTPSIHNSP